jgi:hypothetical protein
MDGCSPEENSKAQKKNISTVLEKNDQKPSKWKNLTFRVSASSDESNSHLSRPNYFSVHRVSNTINTIDSMDRRQTFSPYPKTKFIVGDIRIWSGRL